MEHEKPDIVRRRRQEMVERQIRSRGIHDAGVLAAMSPDRALSVSRRMLKPLDPTTDSPAAKAN